MQAGVRVLWLAGALLVAAAVVLAGLHWRYGQPRPLVGVEADGMPHPPQVVPADARCPVCGMYPARFPRWAAQVHLADGAIRFFESPRELFTWQRSVAARQPEGAVVAAWVTDFAGGGWLPLERAVFVHGSRRAGPMRQDALPAFASVAAADAFIAAHGGHRVQASAIDAAWLDRLAGGGQPGHRH